MSDDWLHTRNNQSSLIVFMEKFCSMYNDNNYSDARYLKPSSFYIISGTKALAFISSLAASSGRQLYPPEIDNMVLSNIPPVETRLTCSAERKRRPITNPDRDDG